MSKRKRELSEDEAKLWGRATAHVKARQRRTHAADERPAPVAPKPKQESVKAPAPRASANAPPGDRGGEKRVRRGKLEIDASVDLHGHTQESARAALSRFLVAAHKRGARTVIVVTGAGRMGQGVLRQRLPEWLGAAPLRAMVTGFAQAHRQHGGAGAYYVFLKKRAN